GARAQSARREVPGLARRLAGTDLYPVGQDAVLHRGREVMTAPVAIAFCTRVLLGTGVAISALLSIVAVLEQRELKSRLTGALPAPELAAAPMASSRRN